MSASSEGSPAPWPPVGAKKKITTPIDYSGHITIRGADFSSDEDEVDEEEDVRGGDGTQPSDGNRGRDLHSNITRNLDGDDDGDGVAMLGGVRFCLHRRNPLLKGGACVPFEVRRLRLGGTLSSSLTITKRKRDLMIVPDVDLVYGFDAELGSAEDKVSTVLKRMASPRRSACGVKILPICSRLRQHHKQVPFLSKAASKGRFSRNDLVELLASGGSPTKQAPSGASTFSVSGVGGGGGDVHAMNAGDFTGGGGGGGVAMVHDGLTLIKPALLGWSLSGKVLGNPDSGVELSCIGSGGVSSTSTSTVGGLPEFKIAVDSPLEVVVEGGTAEVDLVVHFMAKGLKAHLGHIDFSGSKMTLDLHRGINAEVAGISLDVDAARLQLLAASCGLSVSGLGRTTLEVGWDLHGRSPRLTRDGVETIGFDGLELLPAELLARRLSISVSKYGKLSIDQATADPSTPIATNMGVGGATKAALAFATSSRGRGRGRGPTARSGRGRSGRGGGGIGGGDEGAGNAPRSPTRRGLTVPAMRRVASDATDLSTTDLSGDEDGEDYRSVGASPASSLYDATFFNALLHPDGEQVRTARLPQQRTECAPHVKSPPARARPHSLLATPTHSSAGPRGGYFLTLSKVSKVFYLNILLCSSREAPFRSS